MIRQLTACRVVFLTVVLGTSVSFSAAGDITATVIGEQHAVGEPIVVRYQFSGAHEESMTLNAVPSSVGAFDILSATSRGPQVIEVSWMGWDAEATTLPSLPVTLVDASGAAREAVLPAAPLTLTTSLDAEDTLTDFGKHKGALAIPWEWSPRLAAGILSAAAIGAGILGIWLLRPRRETVLSAEDQATAALDLLAGRELATPEDVERFWFDLTGTLRTYISARFDLHAPVLTTREFLEEARASLQVPDDLRERLSILLTFADRVKFARQSATIEEARQGVAFVRSFVATCAPSVDAEREGGRVDGSAQASTPLVASENQPC